MRFTKDNDMKLDTKALQELKERVMRLDFQMRSLEVVLGMDLHMYIAIEI